MGTNKKGRIDVYGSIHEIIIEMVEILGSKINETFGATINVMERF